MRESAGGGIILRDAPGKERDARSPEDILSFHSECINIFLFISVLNEDFNCQMNHSLLSG